MKSKAPDSIASRYSSISPSREHTTKGARDPASFNALRTSWKLPSGRMSSQSTRRIGCPRRLVRAWATLDAKTRSSPRSASLQAHDGSPSRYTQPGWTVGSPHLPPGQTTLLYCCHFGCAITPCRARQTFSSTESASSVWRSMGELRSCNIAQRRFRPPPAQAVRRDASILQGKRSESPECNLPHALIPALVRRPAAPVCRLL
jgi:hypothetical protein